MVRSSNFLKILKAEDFIFNWLWYSSQVSFTRLLNFDLENDVVGFSAKIRSRKIINLGTRISDPLYGVDK